MEIGSFAGLVFEVSADKVLTFKDFSRSSGSRWSVHEINGKKPMPEFIGPGQESIPLKITLKTSHGVHPEKTLNKLIEFKDAGKVSTFIIGNKRITNGYWYLEEVSADYKQIDNQGRILSIEVSLSLKEYPKPPEIRSKPNTQKPKPPTNSSLSGQYIGNVTIKVNMLNCRLAPSLKGKIKKVLRKNGVYRCYGKVKTDIEWWVLGKDLYVSAGSKYTSFRKVEKGSLNSSPTMQIREGTVGNRNG
ncbi:hypothetical protein CD798_08520 [Bacillaceae bacterium SAOS 7]|nr:hypothetical protein CD798_08520 [Bacillaceae bacterium SAOS 7]